MPTTHVHRQPPRRGVQAVIVTARCSSWHVFVSTLLAPKFPKLVVWHYRTRSQAGKIIVVVVRPSF
ncbi:hypothetical protein [Thermogutta sp.]|uniref:hypothetical protein n=1 Tax=Thermogutta sp. TaxID=1962930 RepID=UPI00322078EE